MFISGKTAGEIFEQIRGHVESGNLKSGDVLPPVRELAAELSVNRNTVALAYKRLTDAGFAMSRGRNGTVIRGFTPQEVAQEGVSPGTALRDLASGNPSQELLPEITAVTGRPGLYGEPAVSALLEEIADKWMKPDIVGDFELNLTSGAVDGVERLLASYLIAGDKVAVEDPCFLSSISTLFHNRLEAAPVPVDEEGMQDEGLRKMLQSGVQAIVVTPRAHNPTGFGLSEARALRIRSLLSDYPQVLVIVDDHFSLLSTHPYHHIIPETTRRWALIRSTSKFLGPDMRLAFVASDRETSLRLRQRLNAGTNWVSHIIQKIAATSISSPGFYGEISRVREIYRSRRQRLIDALQQHGIPTSLHHDGLNVWVPMNVDSSETVMKLARYGWLVREGEVFGLASAAYGLRITVSSLEDTEIDEFAKHLAGVLPPTNLLSTR